MDEPLSNLDAKLRVQMRTQVARIQQQLGTTMLYVTHDQTEAMTLGDRVAVMRAGIIQQVDTPKVLYEDPINLFVAGFIGSPAMNFIPARLEEGKVRLPFGDAPIPDGRRLQQARRDRRHPPRALRGRRVRRRHRGRRCASRPRSTSSSRWAPSSTPTSTSRARRRSTPSSSTSSPPTPAWTTSPAAAPRTSSPASTPAQRAEHGKEVEVVLDTTQIKLFDPDGGRSLTRSTKQRSSPRPLAPRGRCSGGGREPRRLALGEQRAGEVERGRRDPAELQRGAEVVAVGPVLDHLAVGDPQPVRLRAGERAAGGRERLRRPWRSRRSRRRPACGGPSSCSARRSGRPRPRPRRSPSADRRTRRAATARWRSSRPGRARAPRAARPWPRG